MSTLLILSSLLVTCMGHWPFQISHIKSTYELFCTLVLEFGPFSSKCEYFFFIYSCNKISGAFLQVLYHWQRLIFHQYDRKLKWILMSCTYTSCKTSYNVLLSHTHVGDWVNLCWSGEKGLVIDICRGGGANAKDRVSRFCISKGWHLILFMAD